MPQASVDFGTSGLRGRAEQFTPSTIFAYVAAFVETACEGARGRRVVIGRDLRASSPKIVALVAGAAKALGWEPVNGGEVPTPALALYALARRLPAIMVTGSHIPPDYNGLKFYRPDGELLKSDEAPMRAVAQRHLDATTEFEPVLSELDPDVAREYEKRLTGAVAPDALHGLRIGIFEHSAVGRDIVARVLGALGAQCVPLGRSDSFEAVDTEALETAQMARLGAALDEYGFDAVVSTDGDGDRPLLVDERGRQINGDVLGVLAARWLGAKTVVTPLTSSGAIELSGWFERVVRTRIGSPYVVEAMADIGGSVVGFEANGGFLVGADMELKTGLLTRLPTRDALLPIIAVLSEANSRGVPVSVLAGELPKRVMRADRLKNVAPEVGGALVSELAVSEQLRARFDRGLARPQAIDTKDGTRLTRDDGVVIHVRQSGNAPELRCYVETDSEAATDAILDAMMRQLAAYFETQDA